MIFDFNRETFALMVAKSAKENPSWRYGQTVFNVAHDFWPVATDKLRGSEFDPFYINSRVPGFLMELEKIINSMN